MKLNPSITPEHVLNYFINRIVSLYRFNHNKEADEMFETTVEAFQLDRQQFSNNIMADALRISGK